MRWLLMNLAAGVVAFGALSTLYAQGPTLPDLEIITVEVRGDTAKVQVGNRGAADAGPCRLLMEIFQTDKKGDKRIDKMTVNVPALNARTKIWITLDGPLALQGPGRKLRFEVNFARSVKEASYENNVRRFPPMPK